jgi:hypothetical protein
LSVYCSRSVVKTGYTVVKYYLIVPFKRRHPSYKVMLSLQKGGIIREGGYCMATFYYKRGWLLYDNILNNNYQNVITHLKLLIKKIWFIFTVFAFNQTEIKIVRNCMCMKKCDLNANCARQQIKVVSVCLPCNVDQINFIRVNYLRKITFESM